MSENKKKMSIISEFIIFLIFVIICIIILNKYSNSSYNIRIKEQNETELDVSLNIAE